MAMTSCCNNCYRAGKLVSQFGNPANSRAGMGSPWVFRFYLCQWHLAAWNRNAAATGSKPLSVLQFKPDNEVISEMVEMVA